MLFTCHILFGEEISTNTISPVDTLIRTTIAAIFGYFLSSNFAHNSINKKMKSLFRKNKKSL